MRDLLAWFAAGGVPAMIVGGVAASILGRPRTTRDVDACVRLPEGEWAAFLEAGRAHGFVPRRADALAFARRSRVLLVRHEPTAIDADLMLAEVPLEIEMLGRAVPRRAGGLRIPLPTPEDLVVMKALANRSHDLADIEAVLDANPKMDVAAALRRVRALSRSLEMPVILRDFESVLRKRRKR